jgi:hypothetical protein
MGYEDIYDDVDEFWNYPGDDDDTPSFTIYGEPGVQDAGVSPGSRALVPSSPSSSPGLTAEQILSRSPAPSSSSTWTSSIGKVSPSSVISRADSGIPISDMPSFKPVPYTAPTFTAPARDENRLRSLTQRAAAPGMRRLRTETQRAIIGSAGLPGAVRRMTLREALAGFGEGASSIMGGASRQGLSEYNAEYRDKYAEAMMNFQGQAQAGMANVSAQNTAEQAKYRAELDRIFYNAKQGVRA